MILKTKYLYTEKSLSRIFSIDFSRNTNNAFKSRSFVSDLVSYKYFYIKYINLSIFCSSIFISFICWKVIIFSY